MVAEPGDLPPPIPAELLARAHHWPRLKRWERRALGIELRALGLSYREIGAIIPVGRGTLSAWCRDIALSSEQRARLAAKRPAAAVRREVGARRRATNLARIEAIRAAARAEAHLLARDPFWVAGVVAYWAEGAKRSSGVKFSNSDPAFIMLFIRWALTHLDITKEDLSMTLHLHDGQDEAERISFWSSLTGIAEDRFGKTFVKSEGSGHRKNILYNGTASVRISRSTDLLHRIRGWWEGIGESLGIEASEPL